MTLDAERVHSNDARSADLGGDRLRRLRATNEEPWGTFLLRTAIKTAVVLAVGSVALLVASIVFR